MANPGRSEGFHLLDDFVCEAIHDPTVPLANPTNQGRNEGMSVVEEVVFDASSENKAGDEEKGHLPRLLKTVWRLLIDEPEITLPWMSDNGRIAIGWGEIGDVRQLRTLDAIAEAIRKRNETHPDHGGKPAAYVQHGSSSLHDFCYQMRSGDLVIVSDGSRRRGVWEIVGEYEYAQPSASPLNYQHQRVAQPVELDPDALWHRAGGRLLEGQINYRTLGRCANGVG